MRTGAEGAKPVQVTIDELVQRLAQAEAAVQAVLNGQADAVFDAASGTHILLREAQTALRESEARFQRLVARMAAIVCDLSPDGTVLFVNDAVTAVTGYAPEALESRNWWDLLFPGAHRAQVKDLYRRLRSADVSRYEVSATAKDGAEVVLELNTANQYLDDGTLVKITALWTDVTERKRAERALQQAYAELELRVRDRTAELERANRALKVEIAERERAELALREGEARFRAVFEQAAVGMAQVGLDGRWLMVNERLCEIVGYSCEELLAKTFQEITHPDDIESDLDHVRRLLEGEADIYAMEKRYLHNAGFVVWALLTVSLVHDDATGDPRYFIAVVEDITVRKRAEEALRRSEEKLRLAQRAAMAGTWDWDLTTDTVTWSDKYCAIYGLDPGSVEPSYENWLRRVHPEDREGVDARAQRVVEERGELALDFRIVRPDGKVRWIHVRGRVLVDAAGNAARMIGIAMDVTERKEVERRKAEFISVVSHELRTPLTSIAGSLGLIKGGVAGGLPAQAKAMVDIAARNADRLVMLINDILDIDKFESRKLSLNLQPVDLMALVEEAIETNRPYAGQFGVRLVLGEAQPGVQVQVDADRLIQVLTNLLSNAAKFSPYGETVTVRMRRNGRMIRVEVSDRGPGIPEEFRARIFDKFAQVDSSDSRAKGGTGLGLSIAKAIIERLGGRIGLETEVGLGTSFFFELPEWEGGRAGENRSSHD